MRFTAVLVKHTMANPLNNKETDQDKNQSIRQENPTAGNKQDTGGQQKPDDRLKDGTNDFQNGDQNETSRGEAGSPESA